MSEISNIIFELERRVILFKPNTSMPDGSQLGFDDDPNNAVGENSDGEALIINCPVGSRYQQSDGTQWYKKATPNDWQLFGSGGGVGGTGIGSEDMTISQINDLLNTDGDVLYKKKTYTRLKEHDLGTVSTNLISLSQPFKYGNYLVLSGYYMMDVMVKIFLIYDFLNEEIKYFNDNVEFMTNAVSNLRNHVDKNGIIYTFNGDDLYINDIHDLINGGELNETKFASLGASFTNFTTHLTTDEYIFIFKADVYYKIDKSTYQITTHNLSYSNVRGIVWFNDENIYIIHTNQLTKFDLTTEIHELISDFTLTEYPNRFTSNALASIIEIDGVSYAAIIQMNMSQSFALEPRLYLLNMQTLECNEIFGLFIQGIAQAQNGKLYGVTGNQMHELFIDGNTITSELFATINMGDTTLNFTRCGKYIAGSSINYSGGRYYLRIFAVDFPGPIVMSRSYAYHSGIFNQNKQGKDGQDGQDAPTPLESTFVSVVRSGKDSNDIFTIITYIDIYSVVRRTSTLSGGTSPMYTTRTELDYDGGGNLIATKTYTISYDLDGNWLGEVMQLGAF